ncbi:MAG: type II toxin-antitoxin system RelE/ParE family toxin [Thermodesulfobacteriota bacterium]|nr:type II toxin-antitoxin system RelE/ParE family toxin [Thermodesulfobacteriota bacterium]
MKIVWSPLAVERASEIVEYISQDNPTAAQNWIYEVFEKVKLLSSSPEMGRVVPEVKRNEIRELLFVNYRILYRIENNSISILTIRHCRQILPVSEVLT